MLKVLSAGEIRSQVYLPAYGTCRSVPLRCDLTTHAYPRIALCWNPSRLRMARGCSLLSAVLRPPSLLYLSHSVLFHVELSSWVLPFLNLLRSGGTKAQDHHRSKPWPLSTDSLRTSILIEVLICGCQTEWAAGEVSRGRRQHRQKNAGERCRIKNVFASKQPFKELKQRWLLYCVDWNLLIPWKIDPFKSSVWFCNWL